jgi:hypothetical protein
MHRIAKSFWLAALVIPALTGCGGVLVKPDQALPKPLMVPMSASAGLVLDSELRGYVHDETRYSSEWKVELGAGHVRLFESVFAASFASAQTFPSVEEARAASGLQAIFQPHIEQFSFATARDTSGGYWAVTIRYRIGVLTPMGEEADSLTLTGYGSAAAKGGSDGALTRATLAAMRDAAAKLLVQLPRQPIAVLLREGKPLPVATTSSVIIDQIEAVPIEP